MIEAGKRMLAPHLRRYEISTNNAYHSICRILLFFAPDMAKRGAMQACIRRVRLIVMEDGQMEH